MVVDDAAIRVATVDIHVGASTVDVRAAHIFSSTTLKCVLHIAPVRSRAHNPTLQMSVNVAVFGHDVGLPPMSRHDRSAVGRLDEADFASRVKLRLGAAPGYDLVELAALVVHERVPGRCGNHFPPSGRVYASGMLDRSRRS